MVVRLAMDPRHAAASLWLAGMLLACADDTQQRGYVVAPGNSHVELRFEDPGTLLFAPGEARAVSIAASPRARYALRFLLLGDTLDAWLDRSDAEADEQGRTHVVLHAPSQAATLRLRASVLDANGDSAATAEIGVAVSGDGFGSIQVIPSYHGLRPIVRWTASAVAGTTCAGLADSLPKDPPGGLVAAVSADDLPVIPSVPVGPKIAVVLRAGRFAWGCADLARVFPGGTAEVPVTVVDKPLDLADVYLAANLTYDASPAPWSGLLTDTTDLVGEALVPTGSQDGVVVLNAMQAIVPASQAPAFAQARINRGWDTLATALVPTLGGLRHHAEDWITTGLVFQDRSLALDLVSDGVPDQPMVEVTRFGGLDADLVGAALAAPFRWIPLADDSVMLAGDISWEPSRLAGALALAAALEEFPQSSTVPEALAAVVDCPAFAASLGAFGTCTVDCVYQLCGSAVAARWKAAVETSAKVGMCGSLTIQAATTATTDEDAKPVLLTGHWLGNITNGNLGATVMGDLIAATPLE